MSKEIQEYKNKLKNSSLKQQIRKASSTIGKAYVIACSRRIHKSSQGNMWMVESDSVSGKFYKVQYFEETKGFFCECKAFEYGMTECKHILSIALIQKKKEAV